MEAGQHIKQVLKPIVSVLLLLLYVVAFLFTPLLEHHHHEHHAVECSDQIEIDPCHRLVYHNDIVHGCEHNQHFSAENKSCDSCDKLLASSPKILTEVEQIELTQYLELLKYNESIECSSNYLGNQSTRAPPGNLIV